MSGSDVPAVQVGERVSGPQVDGEAKVSPVLRPAVRRKAIRWVWLAAVAAAVGVGWWWFAGNVCGLPIGYRIGHYDERFGISREELLSVMSEAERQWESATGQDLLRYDPDDADAVAVNLVFDDRQVATQELERLKSE
ncbi:hypothetical protein COY93_00700 [Candidatus Uhrbacteria bacterium CG_4_10_14_0_8_um_filter_58_22]|uniref:Uncharacterized protein n=1 Tax=Candidatus Uhrbacteria bacterium CG_4_10_14_0_8_um_filter_58_22 TaxID=1975029 RepID=A0A2M7QBY7_9BACT|nr:MAG: hypothetical protein AUJ19_04255 [Parcubacteria group bacterium CG1_02_58_44]PIY63306.1 MAG: hypothetical protein COY93_00700 [Candidatus Uhrbacteria bacterium CG_4_10_14_0_8_um_filter_58_22]